MVTLETVDDIMEHIRRDITHVCAGCQVSYLCDLTILEHDRQPVFAQSCCENYYLGLCDSCCDGQYFSQPVVEDNMVFWMPGLEDNMAMSRASVQQLRRHRAYDTTGVDSCFCCGCDGRDNGSCCGHSDCHHEYCGCGLDPSCN
jgi:hypothetical protein